MLNCILLKRGIPNHFVEECLSIFLSKALDRVQQQIGQQFETIHRLEQQDRLQMLDMMLNHMSQQHTQANTISHESRQEIREMTDRLIAVWQDETKKIAQSMQNRPAITNGSTLNDHPSTSIKADRKEVGQLVENAESYVDSEESEESEDDEESEKDYEDASIHKGVSSTRKEPLHVKIVPHACTDMRKVLHKPGSVWYDSSSDFEDNALYFMGDYENDRMDETIDSNEGNASRRMKNKRREHGGAEIHSDLRFLPKTLTYIQASHFNGFSPLDMRSNDPLSDGEIESGDHLSHNRQTEHAQPSPGEIYEGHVSDLKQIKIYNGSESPDSRSPRSSPFYGLVHNFKHSQLKHDRLDDLDTLSSGEIPMGRGQFNPVFARQMQLPIGQRTLAPRVSPDEFSSSLHQRMERIRQGNISQETMLNQAVTRQNLGWHIQDSIEPGETEPGEVK